MGGITNEVIVRSASPMSDLSGSLSMLPALKVVARRSLDHFRKPGITVGLARRAKRGGIGSVMGVHLDTTKVV